MERFKFIEHTADVKFQAFGSTLEEAFKNAALATKQTIAEDIKVVLKIKKTIKVKGQDVKSLLYEFLEEFLYLLDSEDFLLADIENIKIDEKQYILTAELIGDSASNYEFTNEVKAITYNEMFVKKEKNKWIAQAVLDV
jgi:SHS2 domain-containing protein